MFNTILCRPANNPLCSAGATHVSALRHYVSLAKLKNHNVLGCCIKTNTSIIANSTEGGQIKAYRSFGTTQLANAMHSDAQ